MRWVPFIIFAYLFVLAQGTLGKLLTLERLAIGPVGPDLTVLLCVFLALYARSAVEAMLAGWIVGFLLDLTSAGGAASGTRVGPMAVCFALCMWLIVQFREAIFRERAAPQMLTAGLFCLLAHAGWVTVQSLLSPGELLWSAYGRILVQVVISAVYTALLMPLAHFVLMPCRSWLLLAPPPHRARSRR
jgi:rod shape-determining protein MreD